MKSLYYFNPLTINSLKTEDVAAWRKIYNLIGHAVGMNDRSGTLVQPINLAMHDACRLPELSSQSLSYDDAVDLRVKAIYQASVTLNKPIGIMWSGGIDSTMVVVGFMRNYSLADLKGRIKIILSTEATFENPKFYKEHILPNFEFLNSEHTPWMFNGSIILVTGEFNDQLFGSDLIKFYLTHQGADELNSKFTRSRIFNHINHYIKDDQVSNILIDAVVASSNNYGVKLEKNSDFFWWYNFCFKWQTVHFRIYALTFPSQIPNITKQWDSTYLYHFYQTEEFQLWSINNPQVRYIDDWKNYKLEAKQSIYNFNKDFDYFKNKIKRPSLTTVFNHRILNEAVTEDFEILEKFNPQDYYNPENLFKQKAP